MSLESDIHTVLKTVCDRVYPDFAPNNVTKPYITWQQIGGVAIKPLGKGVPDRRSALIQVNVWATSRVEANDMALDVDSVMRQATAFDAMPQGEFVSMVDEENELRGTMQDFVLKGYR